MPTADSAWKIYANEKAQAAPAYGSFMDTPGYQGSQGPTSIVQGSPLTGRNAGTTFNMDAVGGSPVASDATSQPPAVVGAAYTLESDPVYQAAINAGQSQFNLGRANALAAKTTQEMQLGNERKNLDVNATEARRRTAGNYAARGMAGGAAGALTLAEMQANAKQISAQTSIKDQISALNANYLETYGNAAQTDAAGNKNFDWTSTLVGQNYKTQAAQAALNAQLARMGVQ